MWAAVDAHAEHLLPPLSDVSADRPDARSLSPIVNVANVRSLATDNHRDFDILLDDGTKLRLSRTYRGNLERALGGSL